LDTPKNKILIVDDESLVRDLISKYLCDAGYDTVEVSDGVEAWSILQQPEHRFDSVVLDRNMPKMDGLELLKKIKAHPTLNTLPVIMQTASGKKHEVLEGLQAGCYYYLTKPFEKDLLVSIVKTAVFDHLAYRSLQDELKKQNQSLVMLDSGLFSYRNLSESRSLTALLAAACPEPDKVAMGLSELLINAIEHGNLGISYAEKSQLLAAQDWEKEIERRLTLPEYSAHKVIVEFKRSAEEITIAVTDQGKGFEWQQYLAMSPERASDSHGRGIAMANMLSFNNIEYQGKGNVVKVTMDCAKTD
jgi:CheY-like chemotaxis protein